MADQTLQYPRGTCLVFTTGEYSDFRLAGTIVTIKDCDLPALAQEYAKTTIDQNYYIDLYSFSSWLVARGHAMPAETQKIHLGNYSTFEPEFSVTDEMIEQAVDAKKVNRG